MFKSSNHFKADTAKASQAFRKAESKAQAYAGDPDKLRNLIAKASRKASSRQGALDAVWQQLMACFRLIRAYANGSYRDISRSSLITIIASILYFVVPVDAIPDFIAGLGLIDDAALLGWVVKTFSSEIDAFVEWESSESSDPR
ncbi:hypothetical protein GCM10011348_12320 [Marinobacterium nitratireducens]|uniref:DUF1232 domain-containing protein n=1 Tax=Marinobacterium nitratireducens TaxID=518897 RepID=A0A918DPZ1_9GAMM|nr:YkvA family protein [Marinobacterium nitratireducens]GGO79031.1 hypothetical protein GCM10011348_12320 [Marinobacterium nitratireducens]